VGGRGRALNPEHRVEKCQQFYPILSRIPEERGGGEFSGTGATILAITRKSQTVYFTTGDCVKLNTLPKLEGQL
jgi:hypothetical protein